MTPRARRYLHMLGTIIAILAVVVLGLIGISPVGRELTPPAGFLAAIAALIGYVVYAHRRAKALEAEEAALSREAGDRAFEQLSASALSTGVSLRWRPRTYVLIVVVLAGAAAWAAVAWVERSWLMLVLAAWVFMLVAKALLARLARPEVLRVGPTGIDDLVRYGLIPWQDIETAFLRESEVKGTKVAALSIGVRDPEAYSRRLGPVARLWGRVETLGFTDNIDFQLQALDMAPHALFRLIRAFHERSLPAGAISGQDNFYMVDLEGAKLKEIMAEIDAASTGRQQELAARMDALVKSSVARMSDTGARARRMKARAIGAIGIVLLIVVLGVAGVFSR